MELQLVTFEQAKALKTIGMPVNIQKFCYAGDGKLYYIVNKDFYPAPNIELVAKWLRDEKNIQLTVRFRGKKWYYDIMSGYEILSIGKDEETYEQALSAGIDKAIEILKSK